MAIVTVLPSTVPRSALWGPAKYPPKLPSRRTPRKKVSKTLNYSDFEIYLQKIKIGPDKVRTATSISSHSRFRHRTGLQAVHQGDIGQGERSTVEHQPSTGSGRFRHQAEQHQLQRRDVAEGGQEDHRRHQGQVERHRDQRLQPELEFVSSGSEFDQHYWSCQ